MLIISSSDVSSVFIHIQSSVMQNGMHTLAQCTALIWGDVKYKKLNKFIAVEDGTNMGHTTWLQNFKTRQKEGGRILHIPVAVSQ